MAAPMLLDRNQNPKRAPQAVTVGTLPLHCTLHAAAPADPLVLFLPGIATHGGLYHEFLGALAAEGFNVVALDPRGHGRSGGDRGLYTVVETVADVAAVRAHFAERLHGPLCLMGYSIGSPLALAAAEELPGVAALLCHTLMLGAHPPDLFHAVGWQTLGWTNLLLPGWKVDLAHLLDVDSLLCEARHGRWLREDELLVWEYPVSTLASVFGHRHRALSEVLPFRAAVFTGERDEVVSPAYTRRLLEHLAHPFDTLEIEAGCHMLPFTRAQELARHSAGWLAQALSVAA